MNFDKKTHTYWNEDGKEYVAVTSLLKRQGISPNYDLVDPDLLNASAERGNLIHKEVEGFVKNGATDFISSEASKIAKWLEDFDKVESEVIIWDDFAGIAGTIDLILQKNGEIILADIKSGALSKNAVKWQLSLYAECYEFLTKKEVKGLKCLCFKDGNLRVIDIERVSASEIEKLLIAEKNGDVYREDALANGLALPEAVIDDAAQYAARLLALKEEVKRVDAEFAPIREKLYDAMTNANMSKVEAAPNGVVFTRVGETTKLTFDLKKFKEDHEDLYDEYLTISSVKGFVKICKKE